MSEQGDGFRAGCVDQSGDVAGQLFERVIRDVLRSAGAAIASLIDRPDAVTEADEKRNLMAPTDRVKRKSVQKQRKSVAFPRLEHFELQPIG